MSGPLDIFRLTDNDGQLETCRSKYRYLDEADISADARRFSRGAYHCRVCGGWHLTKKLVKPPGPAVARPRRATGLGEARRRPDLKAARS